MGILKDLTYATQSACPLKLNNCSREGGGNGQPLIVSKRTRENDKGEGIKVLVEYMYINRGVQIVGIMVRAGGCGIHT